MVRSLLQLASGAHEVVEDAVRLPDLLVEIIAALRSIDIAGSLVPEQWPLIRTLQFLTAYREQLASVLMNSTPTAAKGTAVTGKLRVEA